MPHSNVRSEWVGGDLYFKDKSGNTIFYIDGTNRSLTVPSGSTFSNAGTAAHTGTQTFDDIAGGDASLGIDGLAAAQGGAIVITGGTSSTAANAGGAVTMVGGTPGATGVGGAVGMTGGAAVSGAGGAGTMTGGAGGGTGAGGAVAVTGGASGAGATGNGGAASLVGGAAASTNGTGGAAAVTGGVATGTGTGGAITITSGASAGASGTAGSITIDTGAATGGTEGGITIGSAATKKVGFFGATPVVRAAHIADTAGDDATAVNAILVVLENLGFVATA